MFQRVRVDCITQGWQKVNINYQDSQNVQIIIRNYWQELKFFLTAKKSCSFRIHRQRELMRMLYVSDYKSDYEGRYKKTDYSMYP